MIKRLTLYMLPLFLVPIFSWLFYWQWPNGSFGHTFVNFLLVITDSAGFPMGLVTSVLFIIILYIIKPVFKTWKWIALICFFSLFVTQVAKSGLKILYAEPRPYIAEMLENDQQKIAEFYQQPRKLRSRQVAQFSVENGISPRLAAYRISEVGYSFPSGHAMFAALWLMLVVGFTSLTGNCKWLKVVRLMTLVWAVFILISRLELGMHYPIDLLASTLIAWLMGIIIFKSIQKYPHFPKYNLNKYQDHKVD